MKKPLLWLLIMLLTVSMIATFSLAGCKEKEAAPAEEVAEEAPAEEAPAEEAPAAMVYKEAPMLATLVEEGKLPSVEERLPENPMVVEGPEGIGTYGGTVNSFTSDTVFPNVPGAEIFMGAYEPIVSFEEDYSYGNPNIAESYEMSEDGLTMTIHLRKGIKWSDGVPLTADDIMYCFDYEIGNTDLFPVFPEWLTVNGEPVTATKIDDYTVQLNFPAPYPSIMNFLSHANGCQETDLWFGFIQPAHYMKQFHPDFIEGGVDAANAKAVENGFASWAEQYRAAMRENVFGVMVFPDSPPTLNAYICVERDTEHIVWQRNPYYWKVDSEGNQLPYIDELVSNFIGADQEIINGHIISGEADFAQGNVGDLGLYTENAAAGDYRVIQWPDTATSGLVFNCTSKDSYLRELFQNVKFRQAVSLSLDREEMISAYFLGLGTPEPFYCVPLSPYYKQDVYDAAMEYIKYDPDAAKALLAEIGLTQTNADGFLLRPDGKQLDIVFEYFEAPGTDSAELIVSYLKDIGINVIPRVVTFNQYLEDVVNDDVDMSFPEAASGLEPLFTVHPHTAVPYNYSWIDMGWAIEWAHWYSTNGAEGEEPPQEIKDLYDWWNVIKTDPVEENRIEAGRDIWRQMAEKLYKIGLVGDQPVVFIAKNNIKNIPDDYTYNVWNWMRFGPLSPYFYIEGASADTEPNPILYEGPPGFGNVAAQ